MQNPKNLITIGGILLLIGAATPWAIITSLFLGISQSVYGYQTDGLFTGIGGLIILLIGLFSKQPQPDKNYSGGAVLTAILVGVLLVIKSLSIIGISSTDGVTTSIGFGLSCLSPLGAFLAFVGGMQKSPAPLAAAEESITQP